MTDNHIKRRTWTQSDLLSDAFIDALMRHAPLFYSVSDGSSAEAWKAAVCKGIDALIQRKGEQTEDGLS